MVSFVPGASRRSASAPTTLPASRPRRKSHAAPKVAACAPRDDGTVRFRPDADISDCAARQGENRGMARHGRVGRSQAMTRGNVVAVALAMLCCSCVPHHGDAKARVKHWDALIFRDLPRGASSADVESFFARHGLEAGPWSDGTIGAIEHDVEVNGFVSTSISFLCSVDSTGHLEECRTELVSTGP